MVLLGVGNPGIGKASRYPTWGSSGRVDDRRVGIVVDTLMMIVSIIGKDGPEASAGRALRNKVTIGIRVVVIVVTLFPVVVQANVMANLMSKGVIAHSTVFCGNRKCLSPWQNIPRGHTTDFMIVKGVDQENSNVC